MGSLLGTTILLCPYSNSPTNNFQMSVAPALFHESRWETFYCVFIFSSLHNFASFYFTPLYFYSVLSSPGQPQKKSELETSPSHLNCVDEAENLDIPADSGQLTAEERNFPQGSLESVGATVEQLTDEEKAIRQARKEAPDGDNIRQEDSKEAVEERSAKEKVLRQKKKNQTEVS